MSQENVERLKAVYEAFSREDFEAAIEIAHPDVEFTRPILGSIKGTDALRAWMEPDALEAHTVEPLDFRAKGNKVAVRERHKALGASSGLEVDAEVWTVYTFDDDGLVTRVEVFLDQAADALEAVGLREEDLEPAD